MNKIDLNIKLNPQIVTTINFLDLYMENVDGQLFTKLYHKPSHEQYYLPFNSVHPMHLIIIFYFISYICRYINIVIPQEYYFEKDTKHIGKY